MMLSGCRICSSLTNENRHIQGSAWHQCKRKDENPAKVKRMLMGVDLDAGSCWRLGGRNVSPNNESELWESHSDPKRD
jgi:hypothetical protein